MGEQGLLSLVNFCATIILARFLSIDEFGAYALAFTLLMLLQGAQRALVSIPMVVLCPDLEKLQLHSRNWHVIQALVIAAPLIIVFPFFLFLQDSSWVRNVLLALMILLMPMFYYEFYRRRIILERNTTILLPMACAYAAVFSFTLLLVAINGGTAITGAIGMAAGATAATLIGFFSSAKRHTNSFPDFLPFWRDLWLFGRWQLMSHVAYTGYNTLIPVMVSFFVGPAGVALMSVTRNLVQPVQTFIMAIDNVDKPRASAALARSGMVAMQASLRNTSLTLIVPGAFYLLMIGIFAEPTLHLFFAGKYDHGALELRLWLPVFSLMLITQPIESALYVLKRSDILFRGRMWAAIVGLVGSVLFIPLFGVAGALSALTLGWVMSLTMAWNGLKAAKREHHADT